MIDDSVERLSEKQSWELLEGSVFGRIALSVDGQPDIFPLNVYASGGKILFKTSQGTKLVEILINNRIVFETDAFTSRIGWSVVAKGHARILEDDAEIAAAEKTPLHAWVPTAKTHFVEIDVDEITGRRFAFGDESEHGLL